MASYPLMFAHSIENITPDEREWWEATLTSLEGMYGELPDWYDEAPEWLRDVGEDVVYEWTPSGEALVLYNLENVRLDSLARLVQEFLKAHRPNGEEEIDYASFGHREGEVGVFYGGFIYINAKHIIFSDELRKYIGEEIDVREEMVSNG